MAGRPKVNLKGKHVGTWVVVSRVPTTKQTTWLCQCATCHKTREIRHDCLRKDKIPKCKNCKTTLKAQKETVKSSNVRSGFVKGGLQFGYAPKKKKRVIDPHETQRDIGLMEAKRFLATGRPRR